MSTAWIQIPGCSPWILPPSPRPARWFRSVYAGASRRRRRAVLAHDETPTQEVMRASNSRVEHLRPSSRLGDPAIEIAPQTVTVCIATRPRSHEERLRSSGRYRTTASTIRPPGRLSGMLKRLPPVHARYPSDASNASSRCWYSTPDGNVNVAPHPPTKHPAIFVATGAPPNSRSSRVA